MMLNVVILLICGIYFANGQTANYCDPVLCPSGSPHIACNNNGAFSTNCPVGATTLVTLTSAQIANILNQHNTLRAKVASGLVGSLPTAARMQTLQWNTEFANLAALNVKQCTMVHDKCRNTQAFRWCGQNLASWWTSAQSFSVSIDQLISSSIDMWFNEYVYATVAVINSYASTSPTSGHFTAMTQDKAGQVGCAVLTNVKSNGANFFLACNYGYTNVISRPVYVSGPKCSKCTSGCSASYPGLCNIAESVPAVP